MTYKTQPEALRLADHLERFRSFPDDLAAAAELRRLHTENEAKDALLRQALEALEFFRDTAICEADTGGLQSQRRRDGNAR